jgi:ligand-binding sensor domain-containing protein
MEQGLPHHMTNSLLRDANGFMWIGTQAGLVRYDGHRMVVYADGIGGESGLKGMFMKCLAEDRKGNLWVSTQEGGVQRFDPKNNTFEMVLPSSRFGKVATLHHDASGRVWMGTETGDQGLLCYDPHSDSVVRQYGAGGILPYIKQLHSDKQGRLWVGCDAGLALINPELPDDKAIQVFGPLWPGEHRLPSPYVKSIAEGPDGRIWVGSDGGVTPFDPLKRVFGAVFQHNPNDPESLINDRVKAIHFDREGLLWVGTDRGVSILDTQTGKCINLEPNPKDPHSLINNYVKSVYSDPYGMMWIGTDHGVSYYDPKSQVLADRRVLAPEVAAVLQKNIFAIAMDAQRRLWLGTTDGLYSIDSAWRQAEGLLQGQIVRGVLPNPDGSVWVGYERGVAWVRREHGQLRVARNLAHSGRADDLMVQDGPNPTTVNAIIRDHAGRIWAGTWGAGIFNIDRAEADTMPLHRLDDFHIQGFFADREGVWSVRDNSLWYGRAPEDPDAIRCFFTASPQPTPSGQAKHLHEERVDGYNFLHCSSICRDLAGEYWVGTLGAGLFRLDPEKKDAHPVQARGQQINAYIRCLLPDRQGHLWLGTDRGLMKYMPRTNTVISYSIADGLPGEEFNNNSAYMDADGTMYFGTTRGLVSFHPEQLDRVVHPPQALITGLRIFDEDIYPNTHPEWLSSNITHAETITLPYDKNFISLLFTSLDMWKPEKVQFSYKLEGYQPDWEYTDGSRAYARYTGIPPGTYTFMVRAANKEGNWMQSPTLLRLVILPPWYRTWWAYTLYAIVSVGGIYALYLYKINRIRAKNAALEHLVSQRTGELKEAYEEVNSQREELATTLDQLEAEHQKSEALLLNILPLNIAQELKEHGHTKPKTYASATVLFTDFKGFTSAVASMDPGEVVENLNQCFTAFDDIVKRHGLEKIKTIGDAYMAAAGVPSENPKHATQAVGAALEMAAFMRGWKQEKEQKSEKYWDIRIGLHSGPVVAGVVGTYKFVYDIWGDTVNTAARVETAGMPGRVNISDATYRALDQADFERYRFEYRGELEAKGKGLVGMWFVEHASPH